MSDDIVKRLHGEHYCDQCEDDFLPGDDGHGVMSPGLHSLAALEIMRLRAELGDARQSIIDLQGANAAYVKANGRLHNELRAAKLLREGLSNMVDKAQDWFEALEIAHRHLDMRALSFSHPKDVAIIEAALQRHTFSRSGG